MNNVMSFIYNVKNEARVYTKKKILINVSPDKYVLN